MLKSPRLFLLAALLPLALAAAEPRTKTASDRARPPTPAERFAETKQRIDALFKIRTDPPPYAADAPNPFRLPSDLATELTTQPVAAARVDLDRPLTDAELLPRLAAGLRFGGVMEMGDAKARVLINQRNYREGDLISIGYREQTLKLLVKSLDPERLILALNEAELTIRLKKSR